MRYLFIICMVVSFMVAGCNHGQKMPGEVSQKRVNYRETQLLEYVNRNYSNPAGHYELGKYYQKARMYDKAVFELNLALSLAPVHRDAQAALIKTLILSSKEEQSKQFAQTYLTQASVMAEDSLLLGRAFQAEGLDDYALQCYQKATELAPDSADLQKQIGYFYLSKSENGKAQEYFTKSFQTDPYQADVARELGKMGVGVEVPQKVKKNPIGKAWKSVKGIFKKKPKTQE